MLNTSHPVVPNDPNWAQGLKDYETAKKVLPWDHNPHPRYITHRDMYNKSITYNPILQKYNQKEYEKQLSENEQKTLKRSISQFYDNSLKFEQTYDIINLKDKLKGFENHPDYPHFDPRAAVEYKKKYKKITRPYHILSNLSFSQHKFYPGIEVPKDDLSARNKVKPQIVNEGNYRDYNILSNEYKLDDREKKKVDREIEAYSAAKLINDRKDYDIIRNIYYSPEMEKAVVEKEKKKAEQYTHLIPFKGQLYNPINLNVYDKVNLDKKDKAAYNRKNRYRVRPKIEQFYKQKEFDKDAKEEMSLPSKVDYKRFKVSDKRGYDLLNFEDKYNHFYDNFQSRNNIDDWELLKRNCSENETFSTKKIYKDPYGEEDIDENLHNFKVDRRNKLEGLKPMGNEEMYKMVPLKVKSSSCERVGKNLIENVTKPIEMSKSKWFGGVKSIDFGNQRYNIKVL